MLTEALELHSVKGAEIASKAMHTPGALAAAAEKERIALNPPQVGHLDVATSIEPPSWKMAKDTYDACDDMNEALKEEREKKRKRKTFAQWFFPRRNPPTALPSAEEEEVPDIMDIERSFSGKVSRRNKTGFGKLG
jgi:hypothetical protein